MTHRLLPLILVLLLAAPLTAYARDADMDPNGAPTTGTAPDNTTVDEETHAAMDPDGVSAPLAAPTGAPGSLSLVGWLQVVWSLFVPVA